MKSHNKKRFFFFWLSGKKIYKNSQMRYSILFYQRISVCFTVVTAIVIIGVPFIDVYAIKRITNEKRRHKSSECDFLFFLSEYRDYRSQFNRPSLNKL